MNLFATVLTYCQPTANYRGESELNRSVIQKVTDGRFDYPIISPEAMRNALREILAGYGLPCNRERLPDEDQLAVRFHDYPNPEKYVDDFLFGYLVAASGKDRKEIREALVEERGKERADAFTFKRDSILRMNLAKALEPYRHNAVFTQSPLAGEGSKYKNADTSALLHRETAVTAFQFPFALNLNDCKVKPEWARKLLQAIGELNDVAGNHARSYFEMAPASIIVRLTQSLVAAYNTYGFRSDGQAPTDVHTFPEVVDGILHDPPDYAGAEFYLGGKLVKDMDQKTHADLKTKGVTLERDPRKLLAIVAERALGGGAS
jgi:CRISPR-associated protein Cst2